MYLCCVLQVYLENEQMTNVSDFLTFLEELRLEPNRLTYQHLHGLYCQQGDLQGAEFIEKQMQDQNMPMAETLFHHKIAAHIKKSDSDSLNRTLKEMENLNMSTDSAEVYRVQASAFGEMGDLDKVKEILFEAESKKIQLGDEDIFKVLVSCSKGGVGQDSEYWCSKFPKAYGFSNLLRSYLPLIALQGNVDVLAPLYLLVVKDHRKGPKFDNETNALYLISAMIKSGADVEKIFEAISSLHSTLRSNFILHNAVCEAAEHWQPADCIRLHSLLGKKFGSRNLAIKQDFIDNKLIREHSKAIQEDFPLIANFLSNMHALGYKNSFSYITKELFPGLIDLKEISIGDTARQFKRSVPHINWSLTSNLMLTSLFNFRTKEHFRAAADFMLNIDLGYVRPNSWNMSLASAYLTVRDVDQLINIFVGALREKNATNDGEKSIDVAANSLFKVLTDIATMAKGDAPEVLLPVLQKLHDLKIGVPPVVAEELTNKLRNKGLTNLLKENKRLWRERSEHWTQERELILIKDRKAISNMSAIRGGTQSDVYKFYKLPETREDLEHMHNILKIEGMVNRRLVQKMINVYLKEDMPQKALDIWNEYKDKDFFCSDTLLEILAKEFLKHGINSMDIILHHIDANAEHERRVFMSSIMKGLAGLAKLGDHEAVIENINIINSKRDKIMMDRGTSSGVLLAEYVKNGDVDNIERVFNCLESNDLLSTDQVSNLNPMIDVHLFRDDSSAAVNEFLRIARNYQKMPRKSDLTLKLIEEENIEGIQAVLDASIDLTGEENSLYDLSMCFIRMGKIPQARKLLETPGLRFNKEKMSYLLGQMEEIGDLQACDMFVEVSKSIFGCDLDFLYSKLVFCHRDDPEKVEEIYKNILKEEFAPSDLLLLDIAQILEDHGRPVPFEVQHDAGDLDDQVTRACQVGDYKKAYTMVMNSFESGSTSLKCKVETAMVLIKMNKLVEASTLATKLANNFADPEKIQFKRIYYRLLDLLPRHKKEVFLKTLNKAFRKRLLQRHDKDKFTKDTDPTDDYAAIDAMNEHDITKVIALIENGDVSAQTKDEILSKALESKNLENASRLALAICHDDQADLMKSTTKALIVDLLKRYQVSGQVDNLTSFVGSLGPRTNLLLRGHIWVKASLIKCDPEKYLDMLYTDEENSKKWMVNTEVLTEAVTNHPELAVTLEELAEKNFMPAAVLTAKLALAQEDFQKFDKYVQSVPPSLMKSMRAGLFDRIETIEKLTHTIKSVQKFNLDPTIIENITNSCLAVSYKSSPEAFIEAAHVALSNGAKLETFAKSFLVRLANMNGFKYQSDARKLVDNHFVVSYD